MISGQNKIPQKPQLRDLLELLKTDIFTTLNCHAIGKIESFDSVALTVEASFMYQKTYFSSDPTVPPKSVDYPALIDCPVAVLYGGQAALTFPITAGDIALICFNDRDIDNWFATGQKAPPNSLRTHSISDGIAIVGLKSILNPITPYDQLHAKLSWGMTEMGISATQARIANAASTLGGLMANLMTDLTALNTALTAFGTTLGTASDTVVQGAGGTLVTAVSAVQSSITTLASRYAGLLE